MHTTEYQLDYNNIITHVSGSWDDFALENDGEQMISAAVIGTSIWDHISGSSTSMWFETILSYVRIHGKVTTRNYRCDSPELKRFMEMTIIPGEQGTITVKHTILRTEKIDPPVSYRYTTEKMNMTPRCSICSRLFIGEAWREAADNFKPRHNGKNYSVIYTVCDTCKRLLPGD